MISFFLMITVLFGALDTAPVLHNGRIQPKGTSDGSLFIPTKHGFAPLAILSENVNQTIYSDSDFQAIRRHYLEKDSRALEKALVAAYATIAGQTYLKTSSGSLSYPTVARLKTEIFLQKFPIIALLIIGYALSSSLFLFKKKTLATWALLCTFSLHLLLLAARSYILMRPPVSNMYETVLYVPFVAVGVSLLIFRKTIFLPLSSFLALALMILLPKSGELETIRPVLNHPLWLVIHVLMVVGSYALFLLGGILGHLILLQPKKFAPFEKPLQRILEFGTMFLIGGTILGGVWAAQSWGRFWDWDPKESWAFISSGIYLLWIHAYKFKKIEVYGLAVGSIIGLLAITFTWYGVNYVLSRGLHSYGFGEGGTAFYLSFVGAELIFLLLTKIKTIEKKGQNK